MKFMTQVHTVRNEDILEYKVHTVKKN